jgi:3-methylcrotonyl-CoA carboxylase alpha subunit
LITYSSIPNLWEIAYRIICNARALKIRTVAVYSDAHAKVLHVRQADEAAHSEPIPARESYLVGRRSLSVVVQTGAEVLHPCYCFLLENAEFPQAVIDAGLICV